MIETVADICTEGIYMETITASQDNHIWIEEDSNQVGFCFALKIYFPLKTFVFFSQIYPPTLQQLICTIYWEALWTTEVQCAHTIFLCILRELRIPFTHIC